MNNVYTYTTLTINVGDKKTSLNVMISDTSIYSYIIEGFNNKVILEYKFNEHQLKLLAIIKKIDKYNLPLKLSDLIRHGTQIPVFEFGNNITIAGTCNCTKNILGYYKVPFTHTFTISKDLITNIIKEKIDHDNLLAGISFIKELYEYTDFDNGINKIQINIAEYIKLVMDKPNINHELAITCILHGIIKNYTTHLLEMKKYIVQGLKDITDRLQKSGCGIQFISYDFTELDKYISAVKEMSTIVN